MMTIKMTRHPINTGLVIDKRAEFMRYSLIRKVKNRIIIHGFPDCPARILVDVHGLNLSEKPGQPTNPRFEVIKKNGAADDTSSFFFLILHSG